MLTGSCLCGGVKYEIAGELGAVTNCHCSLCRKMSGSAFSSGATISTDSFRFVAGEELLKEWESSPGYQRVFCGRCGSPILKKKDKDPGHLRFRPGTLDSDPGVMISKHIHRRIEGAVGGNQGRAAAVGMRGEQQMSVGRIHDPHP